MAGELPLLVDFLSLTTPRDNSAIASPALADLLCSSGFSPVPTGKGGHYVHAGSKATVLLGSRGQVDTLSISGAACAAVRQAGSWDALLWHFYDSPHRITRMDTALDLPLDAAPVIHRLIRRGRAGRVRLTHKRLLAHQVSWNLALPLYEVAGSAKSTGSVYLGAAKQEVQLVVYDKRQERIKAGCVDPGPWLRFELRVFGVGATLGDVSRPTRLFAHYAGSEVQRYHAVPDLGPWSSDAAGYTLQKPVTLTPMEKLTREIDNSPDLLRWASLADQAGPYGRAMLFDLLARRLSAGLSDSDRAEFLRHCAEASAAARPPLQ